MDDPKTFLGRARSWAAKNRIFGPQAVLKYVFLTYVECLFEESDQFVLKGGNLLWAYIRTPRQTIDLDFCTRTLVDPAAVKRALEKACANGTKRGITFHLKEFKLVADAQAAAAKVAYRTSEGVQNKFELDIVFALPIDMTAISSPLNASVELTAASIENIITDKISASARFAAGNTRLKDFDDLWRIGRSEIRVNAKKLEGLLNGRDVPTRLDKAWITDVMERDWREHAASYDDLPRDIQAVFSDVNAWLAKIL